jgi:ornithine cyclodeaminase/alanine dehydrogenase-like protein (mu-crystallin family)
MLMINGREVRALLPMTACIAAMERAMIAVSSGAVVMPPRLITPLMDGSAHIGLMPASARKPAVYCVKVINIHPQNPAHGLPTVQGFVALFDHGTGVPLALMDAAEISALRTAAASGLATRLLARKDARTHAVMGTGVQARVHIEAIHAVRPVTETLIWGRSFEKAKALAGAEARRTGLKIRAVASPEEAAACDIISTVTLATGPILKAAWLKPGAHVNLVGAHQANVREADSALIKGAAVYVDLMESALNEAGDILIPMREGLIGKSHVIGEIGQLAMGQIPGRQNDRQTTVYKSVGLAAQDLFAACHVYDRALSSGAGVNFSF